MLSILSVSYTHLLEPLRVDPYAFYSELRPNNASRLYDLEGYEWGDAEWLKTRHDFNPYQSPVNIYDCLLYTSRCV